MNENIVEISAQQKGVRGFWDTEACGTHFVTDFRDDKDFYDQYRTFRYETEWHIPLLVPFSEASEKELLEIGCGNGADGTMFAKAGARYTGVDLTQAAVDATSKHFEALGLTGTFHIDNAEKLSFNDGQFDQVYSWGVLHHTPVPQKAFDEVHRVLRKGGKAIIMLYHKNSFNYFIRIMTYMRLRLLIKIFSRFGKWQDDRKKTEQAAVTGLRGNEDPSVYNVHYQHFLKRGWSYLAARNFVHHCTDGPECPYAYVYSRSDARRRFAKFSKVETKVAHFPLRKYQKLKWIPLWIEKIIAYSIGWNLVVYLEK